MNKEQITKAVTEAIAGMTDQFRQEFEGEKNDLFERAILHVRNRISQRTWKTVQKFGKWTENGPLLLPDHTRFYYRKGNTEVILQEFRPQVRIMKFTGELASRSNSSEQIDKKEGSAIKHYSLAVPYTLFLFKFVDGVFTEVRFFFSGTPLKSASDKPCQPYLPNIDSGYKVCLGREFDTRALTESGALIKGNISQQASYVVNHFWQATNSDEWSAFFWNCKKHFADNNEKRLETLASWEEATRDNPLFVVDDINWLAEPTDAYGDIVTRLFEGDKVVAEFQQELYNDIFEDMGKDIQQYVGDAINVAEEAVKKNIAATVEKILAS